MPSPSPWNVPHKGMIGLIFSIFFGLCLKFLRVLFFFITLFPRSSFLDFRKENLGREGKDGKRERRRRGNGVWNGRSIVNI